MDIQGFWFATFPVFLGIVALSKGWKLRKKQPFQIAVIFAMVLFALAILAVNLCIKFPVL